MALRRPRACRHADRARCRKELERSPRVLRAMPPPSLVQRKNGERSRRHGDVDFFAHQLSLCFAEEKSDCTGFLRRRARQRNAKLPWLIGIVEGDGKAFFF